MKNKEIQAQNAEEGIIDSLNQWKRAYDISETRQGNYITQYLEKMLNQKQN